MFLDHDARGIPPRWEPPRRAAGDRRRTNAATTLIVLVSAIALGAPIAGATLIEVVIAALRSG